MWVKIPGERRCGTCGVVVDRWILHNGFGHRVAEANFCSVCYPNLERTFHTSEKARDAVPTTSGLTAGSEAKGAKIPLVLGWSVEAARHERILSRKER